GVEEHARGFAAHLQRYTRPKMGGGGRRLRRQWRNLRRELRGGGRREERGAGRPPYPRLPTHANRAAQGPDRPCRKCLTSSRREQFHAPHHLEATRHHCIGDVGGGGTNLLSFKPGR